MIGRSLGIRSGFSGNGLFYRLMMFLLLRGYARGPHRRDYLLRILRCSGGFGLGVLVGLGMPPGDVAGGGKEIPAITKEPGQTLVPLAVSQTGGEFLKGGPPRLRDEEGLQGVARGKAQLP